MEEEKNDPVVENGKRPRRTITTAVDLLKAEYCERCDRLEAIEKTQQQLKAEEDIARSVRDAIDKILTELGDT